MIPRELKTVKVHEKDALEIVVTIKHIVKGVRYSPTQCPLALAAYERYGRGNYAIEDCQDFIHKFDQYGTAGFDPAYEQTFRVFKV